MSENQFSTARTDDIEQMSYEQARDELAEVVTKLETGGAPLEESLALWQRGEALADRCERWLDGASARLQEVRESLNEKEAAAYEERAAESR
ncbi:exodeoxyribonuclease VII small subunit [Nesterenkonia haasae]|uniref:exodeoxyribonuclease VII small subunit n=1 Tax=Nesterenkonia haasae TaxID=2587813 RepID=UPI001391B03B|nr:exodeoxyribonuclease VII small subunit [Nesterenkonia haasae]NDK30932.1 exodeoxyribonuclease VII small subunit [Nesterenkonia haasae]